MSIYLCYRRRRGATINHLRTATTAVAEEYDLDLVSVKNAREFVEKYLEKKNLDYARALKSFMEMQMGNLNPDQGTKEAKEHGKEMKREELKAPAKTLQYSPTEPP